MAFVRNSDPVFPRMDRKAWHIKSRSSNEGAVPIVGSQNKIETNDCDKSKFLPIKTNIVEKNKTQWVALG